MSPHATLQQRSVYDPLLRLIHAWNALAVLSLLATAMLAEAFEHGPIEARVWNVHVLVGYALAGGLAARLAWGFVGPRYARWSDLWHPGAWKRALKLLPGRPRRRFGHDPLASLAYLAVYGTLAVTVLAGLGLAAIELDRGPFAGWLSGAEWLEDLFEEPHEALAWVVGGFVALHLGALFVHARDGIPVARAMITGVQYRAASGVSPIERDDADADDATARLP